MRTLSILLAICLATNAGATTLYVDQTASGANDGSSWTNAFVDLQPALQSAVSDDQIWIAQGIYTPTTTRSRAWQFTIPSGVQLYGGFAGTESVLEERDPATFRTVLSGDVGEQRPTDAPWDPTASWAQDNSYRLVLLNSTNSSTRLDGLELRESGRALDILGGAPKIVNCVVRWNHATGQGIGALVRMRSMPEFTDVVFAGNSSEQQNGGGVASDAGSRPTFLRVEFRNNSAALEGGGMSGIGDFTDVSFIGNRSTRGGGLAGSGRFHNVSFESNDGGMYGGGLWSDGGVAAQNVLFIGNTASQGAALYVGMTPGVSTGDRGSSTLVNLTAAANDAFGGAMIEASTTTLNLVSAVLADPGDTGINHWFAMTDATVTVSHSLVTGSGGSGTAWNPAYGIDLGGNLDTSPGYVGNGDFHLAAGAPAIDNGDTGALEPGTETDLDGNPRIAGDGVDMGAWEFQGVTEDPVDNALFAAQITPRTLNVRSQGKFVQLELMALGDVAVQEIDPSSLRLQGSLEAVPGHTRLDDGVLKAKFDREALAALVEPGRTASITVTGSLFDGLGFSAIDEIGLVGFDPVEMVGPVNARPNPFNPATTISFDLSRSMRVELSIYDLSGRRVRSLISTVLAAGSHGEMWRGQDDAGRAVSSGVYFARLHTEDGDRIGRLVLVK